MIRRLITNAVPNPACCSDPDPKLMCPKCRAKKYGETQNHEHDSDRGENDDMIPPTINFAADAGHDAQDAEVDREGYMLDDGDELMVPPVLNWSAISGYQPDRGHSQAVEVGENWDMIPPRTI